MEARNANYAAICRQLTFISRAWFEDEAAALPAAPSAPRGKLGLPAPVVHDDGGPGAWVAGARACLAHLGVA